MPYLCICSTSCLQVIQWQISPIPQLLHDILYHLYNHCVNSLDKRDGKDFLENKQEVIPHTLSKARAGCLKIVSAIHLHYIFQLVLPSSGAPPMMDRDEAVLLIPAILHMLPPPLSFSLYTSFCASLLIFLRQPVCSAQEKPTRDSRVWNSAAVAEIPDSPQLTQ